MMKQLFCLLAVFAIVSACLAGWANAAGLEYYGIEDTIREDLSVKNVIILKFNSTISHLDYRLAFKIHNLSVSHDFASASCRATDEIRGTLISCDFVGINPQENQLTLTFETVDTIQRIDDKLRFSVNYGISLPIERSFVLIRLPENGVLSESEINRSYYPQDGILATDGRRIMVYWEDEKLATGENLQFAVSYVMPAAPADAGNSVLIVIAIMAVVIIAVGFYTYKIGRLGVKSHEMVKSVLNKDEKTIVDILNKHEGRVVQKAIVRESDFSKAKVSRLIKNLKDRGVIEVEPVSGRENRIILKIKVSE